MSAVTTTAQTTDGGGARRAHLSTVLLDWMDYCYLYYWPSPLWELCVNDCYMEYHNDREQEIEGATGEEIDKAPREKKKIIEDEASADFNPTDIYEPGDTFTIQSCFISDVTGGDWTIEEYADTAATPLSLSDLALTNYRIEVSTFPAPYVWQTLADSSQIDVVDDQFLEFEWTPAGVQPYIVRTIVESDSLSGGLDFGVDLSAYLILLPAPPIGVEGSSFGWIKSRYLD